MSKNNENNNNETEKDIITIQSQDPAFIEFAKNTKGYQLEE